MSYYIPYARTATACAYTNILQISNITSDGRYLCIVFGHAEYACICKIALRAIIFMLLSRIFCKFVFDKTYYKPNPKIHETNPTISDRVPHGRSRISGRGAAGHRQTRFRRLPDRCGRIHLSQLHHRPDAGVSPQSARKVSLDKGFLAAARRHGRRDARIQGQMLAVRCRGIYPRPHLHEQRGRS